MVDADFLSGYAALFYQLYRAVFNHRQTIQGTVDRLSESVRKLFLCNGALLFLLDDTRNFLILENGPKSHSTLGLTKVIAGENFSLSKLRVLENSIYSRVLEKQKEFIISNPEEIDKLFEEGFEAVCGVGSELPSLLRKALPEVRKRCKVRSVVILRLESAGQPIGILEISGNRVFTGKEIKMIQILNKQISKTISLKLIREESDRRFQEYKKGLKKAFYSILENWKGQIKNLKLSAILSLMILEHLFVQLPVLPRN